ncbi:MAG TPA: AI-2E family transporter [Candidatus Tectomicrobia bacterium]|nr:AI-2E family transporter [Candidatus Tectomicrobia bacterium]
MIVRGRLPWPLVLQVLAVLGAVWLVVQTWKIWLLGFTALVVAAAMLPAARVGERYRVPRGVTVGIVYLLVIGVVALVGRLVWPALAEQAQQFMQQLPRLIENVKGWLGDLAYYIEQWGAPLPSFRTPGADNLQSMFGTVLANTFRVTAGAFGAALGLLTIVVIAAYLVIDAPRVGAMLLSLLPPEHRPTARRLAPAVLDRVGGYVRGQLLSSVFVGALIAAALSILGVRYSLLIGAIAAVFNIVPFVGAAIAGILGVLSALNESLTLAIATALVMWAAQAVEGKFLAPHFVGRATGLHPLAVLLALLAGAHLAGLIGALVAVPFMAGVWEVIRTLWVDPRRDG